MLLIGYISSRSPAFFSFGRFAWLEFVELFSLTGVPPLRLFALVY